MSPQADSDSILLQTQDGKFKFALISINEVLPHEDIDEKHLEELLVELKEKGYIEDPLVVDENTLVILDGMHRLEALRRLSCNLVPCMLVDYTEEEIKISKWIRKINIEKENVKFDDLLTNALDNIKEGYVKIYRLRNDELKDFTKDIEEKCFILLKNYLILIEKIDLEDNNIIIRKLDKTFKKINYIAVEDIILKEKSLYYASKKIFKEEVVAYAKQGKLFPPKTTRHILPYRARGLKIPLYVLSKSSSKEALEETVKHLISNKNIKIISGKY